MELEDLLSGLVSMHLEPQRESLLCGTLVFQLLEKEESQYMLSCQFRNCEDKNTWILTSVYGPTIGEERVQLWEDLGAIRGRWQGPWCIGGDFNALRFPDERNREGRLTSVMRKFSQIIDELELKDTPLSGGQYTWKGVLNNRRMTRLDRFLIADDWETLFGGANQSLLPRPLSDHHQILLEGGRCTVKGPLPFRFENMWLKEEGLKTLVEEWWRSYEVRGTGSFV